MNMTATQKILVFLTCAIGLLSVLSRWTVPGPADPDAEADRLYRFELAEDGTSYILSGLKDPNLEEAVVPAVYRGLPVTVIGSFAFSSCEKLKTVILPEGIRIIKAPVPSDSPLLRTVVLPKSIEQIGENVYSEHDFYELHLRYLLYRGSPEDLDPALLERYRSLLYWYAEEQPEEAGRFWHEVDGRPVIYSTGDTQLQFELNRTGTGYSVRVLPGDDLSEIVIPDEYSGVPVTEIAEGGFRGCAELKRVVLPKYLQRIGDYAFAHCEQLEAVVIPGSTLRLGAYCFAYCGSLKEAVVPGRVQTIGEYAFYQDSALREITLEEGIRNVEQRAFASCSALKTLRLPDSVLSVGNPVIANSDALTELYLPACAVAAYSSTPVLHACPSLELLVIADSAAGFDGRSIWGGSVARNHVRDLVLPSGLEEVVNLSAAGAERIFFTGTADQWDFLVLTDDESMVHARNNCPYFYTEQPPEEAGRYWHYDESGDPAPWPSEEERLFFRLNDAGDGYLVSALPGAAMGDAVIPEQYRGLPVTAIDYYGFAGCEDLSSMQIPGTVQYILDGAFARCTGLTEILLPDSVRYIGKSAFRGCTGLTRLRLSETLEVFCLDAAEGCTDLRYLVLPDSLQQILYTGSRYIKDFAYEAVVLPAGVTGTTSLRAVEIRNLYYRGSEEAFEEEMHEPEYMKAEMHVFYYTEDPPEEAGNYWHFEDGIPVAWPQE